MDDRKLPTRAKSKAANAITYGHVCGPELRPNGSMTIEQHQEVGRLIKSVLAATLGHRGIENCLNMIRGDLEEWAARELTRVELQQSKFLGLYYEQGEHEPEEEIDKREIVKRVELVKRILARSYPDCVPLRSVLRYVDRTLTMIRRWTPRSGVGRPSLPHMLVRPQLFVLKER